MQWRYITFGNHIPEGGVLAILVPQVRSFMEPGDCLEPVTENQTLVFPIFKCFSEHFSLKQTFCVFYWMSEQTHVELYIPAQPDRSCFLLLSKRVRTKKFRMS
jgi:hypothetical protein